MKNFKIFKDKIKEFEGNFEGVNSSSLKKIRKSKLFDKMPSPPKSNRSKEYASMKSQQNAKGSKGCWKIMKGRNGNITLFWNRQKIK